jgi:hypothetical protein
MKKAISKKAESHARHASEQRPRRVRLPGFITEEEVGLGDLVKRVTSAAGIKPCGGCQQRAAALNRWLVFTGSRSR